MEESSLDNLGFENLEMEFIKLQNESRKLESLYREKAEKELPLVEMQSHAYTANDLPPYLLKSFFPFYQFLTTRSIISVQQFYFRIFKHNSYSLTNKRRKRKQRIIRLFLFRNFFVRILWNIFLGLLWLIVLVIFDNFLNIKLYSNYLFNEFNQLSSAIINTPLYLRVVFVVMVMILTPLIRDIVKYLFRKIFDIPRTLLFHFHSRKVLSLLSNKSLLNYKKPSIVIQSQIKKYPVGTNFIIHTMDTHFMNSGIPKFDFYKQLCTIKKQTNSARHGNLKFLIFIDSRRIEEDLNFLKLEVKADHIIILRDCLFKKYIEQKECIGIKINPAMGYYPFDKSLLLLWLYAVQQQIPIIAHCDESLFYYRGIKKKQWDWHPVFKELIANERFTEPQYDTLFLGEYKNHRFYKDFVHPMNYLCLLEERQLRQVIAKTDDLDIHRAYGFTNLRTPLKRDLRTLKICLSGFGGSMQWLKYIETQNVFSRHAHGKKRGINFFYNSSGNFSPSKGSHIWQHVDWYSIIVSMVLQYENVYMSIFNSDLDARFNMMLNQCFKNPILRSRILWSGNDSEINLEMDKSVPNLQISKDFWNLTKEEFDLISRENPNTFFSLIK